MLVFEDGSLKGSVSGGCLEAEAYARAQEMLRVGGASHFEYDLTKDVQEGEGMVCGGKVRVFVECLGKERNANHD
jgi:xanthine dehydrogenase accessory factor